MSIGPVSGISNINIISQVAALSQVSKLQKEDKKKTEKVEDKKFKYIDRTTPTLLKPTENKNGDLMLPFDENTKEYQPSERSCLPTCVYHALKESANGTGRKFEKKLEDIIMEMYGKGGVLNDRGGTIEEASHYLKDRGMTAFWKSYTPPTWVKEGIENGYYVIASINAGPMRHAILIYGYNKKNDEYSIFDPNPEKGILKMDQKELFKLMNNPGAATFQTIPVRTIALTGPPAMISNGIQNQTEEVVGDDVFQFANPQIICARVSKFEPAVINFFND